MGCTSKRGVGLHSKAVGGRAREQLGLVGGGHLWQVLAVWEAGVLRRTGPGRTLIIQLLLLPVAAMPPLHGV